MRKALAAEVFLLAHIQQDSLRPALIRMQTSRREKALPYNAEKVPCPKEE